MMSEFNPELDYREIFKAGLSYAVDQYEELILKNGGFGYYKYLKLTFYNENGTLWISGPVSAYVKPYSRIPVYDPSNRTFWTAIDLTFLDDTTKSWISPDADRLRNLVFLRTGGHSKFQYPHFDSIEEMILTLEMGGYLKRHDFA